MIGGVEKIDVKIVHLNNSAYRNNEYSVSKHLDNIDDPGIRELLASMLERNPAQRRSAEIYLAQARGTIFPEYFYSFLQSYMLIFSAAPILSPDEKIVRLKKDIGNIINILAEESERVVRTTTCGEPKTTTTEEAKSSARECNEEAGNVESTRDGDSGHSEENTVVEVDSDQSSDKTDLNQIDTRSTSQEEHVLGSGHDTQATETEEARSISEDQEKQETTCDVMAESEKPSSVPANSETLEGLVIITQLVTSCIRGLHHLQSKLHSLEILLELAKNVSDETILDRILPYIVSLVRYLKTFLSFKIWS